MSSACCLSCACAASGPLQIPPRDVLCKGVFSCDARHDVQVPYHGSSTASVSTHDVRLPKESTVGDLLDALMQQLPADKRPKQLRLLEIFNGKIYQVLVSTLVSAWSGT